MGGLSCACLLIKEGFEVLVLEKARKIVPAGAVSCSPSKCHTTQNRPHLCPPYLRPKTAILALERTCRALAWTQ